MNTRRAYEMGLIHGRIGHPSANGYLLPWSRRAYAQGYRDGRTHYLTTREWWARQQVTA